MIVKWIKRIIWIVFVYLIWRNASVGSAMLFLVITIVFDFKILVIAGKLAIKGFQEGNTPEDLIHAQNRFIEYQSNPFSPSKPLVTFSQLIFAPMCSLGIPFVIAGLFLGWYN